MGEITTAMVLAAGLGTRIRALDPDTPKPLIPVAGEPLIGYALKTLQAGGVKRFVINVHHKAEQIERYAASREDLNIALSDEREQLLETGGGILKAMPLLGDNPFFCTNTDAILHGGSQQPAEQLASAWSDDADALLLMVPVENASGYQGSGDFSLSPEGLVRPKEEGTPLIFTGLQVLRPSLFADAPIEPVSTRVFWEKAKAAGRMRGVVFDGAWMHVGDPEGHREAEARLSR